MLPDSGWHFRGDAASETQWPAPEPPHPPARPDFHGGAPSSAGAWGTGAASAPPPPPPRAVVSEDDAAFGGDWWVNEAAVAFGRGYGGGVGSGGGASWSGAGEDFAPQPPRPPRPPPPPPPPHSAAAAADAAPAAPAPAAPAPALLAEPGPAPLLPPLSNVPEGLRKRKLCVFWEAGTCRRGGDCHFAHGPDELIFGSMDADYAKRPMTARMDFTALDTGRAERSFSIPSQQVSAFMTEGIRKLLIEVTGVFEVQWQPERCKVNIVGTPVQLDKAARLLQRATVHCQWGINEPKIRSILKPRTGVRAARVRLAPMVPALKDFSITLTADKSELTIGSDPANVLRVKGKVVSRAHALIEFDQVRGAVYVVDTSTNGTFLNGRRLPQKASGKVLLSHGDELLLQEPGLEGEKEFGYMANIELS